MSTASYCLTCRLDLGNSAVTNQFCHTVNPHCRAKPTYGNQAQPEPKAFVVLGAVSALTVRKVVNCLSSAILP
eukprot:2612191-Amphidinium_carterae.1